MNCSDLTQLISDFRETAGEVADFSDRNEFGQALEKVRQWKEKREEVLPKYDEIFMRRLLSREAALLGLGLFYKEANFSKYEELFRMYFDRPTGILTNETYHKFLGELWRGEWLESWKKVEISAEGLEKLEKKRQYLSAIMESVFINLFASGNTLTRPRSERNYPVGIGFHRGKLRTGGGSDSAFEKMSGGEAWVSGCVDAGEKMSGGELHVKSCNSAGHKMSGGNLTIDDASNAGIRATGGTIHAKEVSFFNILAGSVGGTALVEKVVVDRDFFIANMSGNSTVLILGVEKSRLPSLFSDSGVYFFSDGDFCSTDILHLVKQLKEIPKFEDGEVNNGLYIITGSKLPYIWDLNGGIYVLRDLGTLSGIGRGMSGGIIIIDDPMISLEEARRRASSDKTGGMVFYLQRDYGETTGKFFKKLKDYKFIRLT